MESLCIMSGEKVWQIRVDVHVLNHSGNIIDCASIAAITSLAHFRRPDVSVHGEDVTIHTLEEKEPLPLSIRHMPICVTFAFFEQGKYLLIDPVTIEEKVMKGKMVIGMNKHREICTLQMTGDMLLLKDQVLRCSHIAVVKVAEITQLIQKALDNDTKARSAGEKFGFAVSIETEKITANQKEADLVDISDIEEKVQSLIANRDEDMEDTEQTIDSKVNLMAPGTGEIGGGGQSSWDVDDDMKEETPSTEQIRQKNRRPTPEPIDLSDESEEEEVVMLGQDDIGFTKNKKHNVELSGDVDLSVALKKHGKEKIKKKSKKKA